MLGLTWFGASYYCHVAILQMNLNIIKRKDIKYHIQTMAIGRVREVCKNESRLIEGLETSLSLIEDDVFVSW